MRTSRSLPFFLLLGGHAIANARPWRLFRNAQQHPVAAAPNQTVQSPSQPRERMEAMKDCLVQLAQQCGIGHGGLSCCNRETLPPLKTSKGSAQRFESREAAAVLRDRHVVFMGDSTVSSQMQYLTCLLKESEDYSVELDPKRSSASNYIHHSVRFPTSNILLEFVGTGRRWRKLNPFDLEQVLPEKVKSMGPADVVIVNSGLHDNTKDQMLNASVRIAQAVADTVKGCRHAASPCPFIVWRETTPTHFSTQSGNWIDPESRPMTLADMDREGPPEFERGKPVRCYRLKDVKRTGWSNFRNEMTNPILEKAGVNILKTFDVLTDLHQEHCGGRDCLHGSVAVYDYMTMDTLAMLSREPARAAKTPIM